MEKYFNADGQVAVLYSPGYGAGWSTWNDFSGCLIFDSRIVELVLQNKHEEITKSWLLKHFTNQPKQIYHSRTEDESPIDYKTRIMKESDIDVFIESDPVICRHLEKECEGKIIVNFAEFCQMYLNYNAGY